MYSILLCRPTSAVPIIPAYRKHPRRDYTYNTVHTVYTATQLTTSVYCNYKIWHSSQWFIDWTSSSTVTLNYVHMLIYWLYWVWYLNDICKFSKVEDFADASKHVGVFTIYKILLIYIYIYMCVCVCVCVCCAFVGLDNKLYKMHGTCIKVCRGC
jgi:hypothetical protein